MFTENKSWMSWQQSYFEAQGFKLKAVREITLSRWTHKPIRL